MDAISLYIDDLTHHDFTFTTIDLRRKNRVDLELADLANCLLIHPNVVTSVFLTYNELTDKTGVKLAQYLTVSSTIKYLDLLYNHFSAATYLAIAEALRVNSSLLYLCLYGNNAMTRIHIVAFVDALRLNPVRPLQSEWRLSSWPNIFEKLKNAAEKSTPPSMLEFLLCVHLDTEKK
jgi:hypothetical protein